MVLLDLEVPAEYARPLGDLLSTVRGLPPARRARLVAYLIESLAREGAPVLRARDVSRYVLRKAACRHTRQHAEDLAAGEACGNCGLSPAGTIVLPPQGQQAPARLFVLPGDTDVDPVPMLAALRDS